jgi:hypothetical protein
VKGRRAPTFAAVEAVTVHAEGKGLATGTASRQRLAVRVNVVTAALGAVLGGFGGAVAARIVGI